MTPNNHIANDCSLLSDVYWLGKIGCVKLCSLPFCYVPMAERKSAFENNR